MSIPSPSPTPALSRSRPSRRPLARGAGRPAPSCPIRRPSHRPETEPPLTWEELLGRR